MKRYGQTTRPQLPSVLRSRRGFFAPLVALALLVAMGAAALVLDTLWLQAASVELEKCAEAAALAAASELVSDELLLAGGVTPQRAHRAIQAARQVAEQNLVAGQPVPLNPDRDIRISRLQSVRRTSGRRSFQGRSGRSKAGRAQPDSSAFPLSVVVTAHRTRERHNPVAMLLRPPGGPAAGDVVATVEVILENRVRGLAAGETTPLPLLPLAILAGSTRALEAGTWAAAIEGGQGQDEWSFDSQLGSPAARPDGLPELTLRFANSAAAHRESDQTRANAVWLDLGTRSYPDHLRRQLLRGVTAADLAAWRGVLTLHPAPLVLPTADHSDWLADQLFAELQALVGQRRLCWLFRPRSAAGQPATVQCVRLVAVRVVHVDRSTAGQVEVTVQPCVFLTPSALVPAGASDNVRPNPYVYKAVVLHYARNVKP